MTARPTLRDIAKATGYHFTTVGLAMRGDRRISPGTAEKIRAAAQKLGYVQDAMLSALSSYRHARRERFAGLIGYLHAYGKLPEVFKVNEGARRMYEGAREHAEEKGFRLYDLDYSQKDLSSGRITEILRARGIRGVILTPMVFDEPDLLVRRLMGLDWSFFSAVSISQSIEGMGLRLHCVAPNHQYTIQLQLNELRRLGYRRIGLQIYHRVNHFTKGTVLGAYMVDQVAQPKDAWIPPLLSDEMNEKILGQWLRRHQPDCIIGSGPKLAPWIEKLGYRVPEDIGLSVIARAPDSPYAGIVEQHARLGAAAVDSVISLVQSNEQGLPQFPRITMIEGVWIWQPSVRAQAPG